MKRAKTFLKTLFSTGKKPTQDNYADWLDSFVHLDDQAAVDQQIVSQLLVTYDQNLRTRNQNGPIDSLGDVYYFLKGQLDSTTLADTFAKISWGALPNKPNTVPVQLTTLQYVATGTDVYDPQPRENPIPGVSQNVNPATAGLLDIGKITQKGNVVINDIQIQRRWISIPNGGSAISFYTDVINGVIICISPNAKLN